MDRVMKITAAFVALATVIVVLWLGRGPGECPDSPGLGVCGYDPRISLRIALGVIGLAVSIGLYVFGVRAARPAAS